VEPMKPAAPVTKTCCIEGKSRETEDTQCKPGGRTVFFHEP
jgi:hypothetical protein